MTSKIRRNQNVKATLLGHLGAVVAVSMWGYSFVSSKVLLENGMGPTQIYVCRFILAYLLILLLSHKRLFSDFFRHLRPLRRLYIFYSREYGTGIYADNQCVASHLHVAADNRPACRNGLQDRKNRSRHDCRLHDCSVRCGMRGVQQQFGFGNSSAWRFPFAGGCVQLVGIFADTQTSECGLRRMVHFTQNLFLRSYNRNSVLAFRERRRQCV